MLSKQSLKPHFGIDTRESTAINHCDFLLTRKEERRKEIKEKGRREEKKDGGREEREREGREAGERGTQMNMFINRLNAK